MPGMADDQSVSRPNPDPTEATILLVSSRIDSLRETIFARFEGMDRAQKLFEENLTRVPTALDKALLTQREFIDARLSELKLADTNSTMQREMILRHNSDNLNGIRDLFNTEINRHKQLYMEKFASIEETIKVLKDTINDRFTQNDQNTEKAFNAAKQAVGERDASNAASANKSEKNLMDAIAKLDDNLKTLSSTTSNQIASNKSTLDDKISDQKDLISRLDNRLSSGESSKKSTGDSVVWLFAGIAAISGVAGIIGLIFALMHHT